MTEETTASYTLGTLANPKSDKPSKLAWGILFACIVALGVGIYFIQAKVKTSNPVSYSAVFLANGQVYFGKLENDGEYTKLTNVYYIQNTSDGSTTNTSLVPLLGELHQPTDQMEISKNQILYTETLASSSPVTKSIIGK